MATNPDFDDLLSAFCAAEVRFLVVGAHAVIHYTVPRYTKDLDLWIDPTPENAKRAYSALVRFGAPLEGIAAEDLSTPGVVLQIGVEPNRVDLMTEITGLVFAEAWQRRVLATYGGSSIGLLSLEDLVTSKRAAGRPQDRLDLDWLERVERRR